MEELTASESLLVWRWFTLLQKYYCLYNVDYSHQCLTGRCISESAERSSIVRVFQGIDHFFGCVQCGQYHICRKSSTTCFVVSDRQQQRLFCLYSGYLLEEEYFETQPFTLESDNFSEIQADEHQSSTGTSLMTFGKQDQLYSNIKKGGGGDRKRREKRPKAEEAEWSHIDKRTRREVTPIKSPKTESSSDSVEFCVDDQQRDEELGDNDEFCFNETSHQFLDNRLSKDYNYQYWSNYYSFLWNKILPNPNPITQNHTKQPLIHLNHHQTRQKKYTSFNYHLGTNGIEIEKECHDIIRRLLILSPPPSTSSAANEQIFLLLVEYFVPLVKNFYLLIHNSPVIRGVALDKRNNKAGKKPPVMTPKQVSEAVLLHSLVEAYYTEDICQNRIQLWVRNPWLVFLSESGIIVEYYKKYLNKNGNTFEKALVTKNDIKECLSIYFTHSHWLYLFIHTNRVYNNL